MILLHWVVKAVKISKWHQELDQFIDIKSTFIMEGNIYDMQVYPSRLENNEIRWDLMFLDNYIFRYLKDAGYKNIVFYNHIDGFYNEFDREHLNRFCQFTNLGKLGNNEKSLKVDMCRAADLIREANQNRENLNAIVLVMASRYVLSADNISENERDFYTKIMMAGLKKTQISTEDGFKNNLIFIICEKSNDIPVWLYLDNPMAKTMRINEPNKEIRELFINTQIKFFTGDKEYSEEDLKKYKEDFVELTDGFKNLELNALKFLCKKQNIPIENIKDAIHLYKYGIKDNPWVELPLEMLDNAEQVIRKRVKGQDRAVSQVLDIIKRAVTNMAGLQHSSASRPKGVLFFAGPTGTGKTELAKTFAEMIFGDENNCIRFDMSEYQQPHSDQKLLGAPPGYVGYEAGGQLTNAIKEKPFSILLFDEIEKAHPSIFDKFLQILDDGRMTDGKGETVYFSECIIIFTSNLGIYDLDEYGNRILNVAPSMDYSTISNKIIRSIENYFKLQLGRPEILNRIGENIVVFDFIREEVATQILDSQLNKIINNVKKQKDVTITVSNEAKDYLVKVAFGNLENGGRGIGNIVEKNFINPLARYIFDNKIQNGSRVNVKKIVEENSIIKLECDT
ncbi:MAG: ATP-dependent Clp protease ATP-binding subunit [Clostridiales bacterium]|nr:ATP-dependent Clp protease ATP-binding subunit [Clostridiales bacterium]